MDEQHSDLLDRARALAIAKALIEREIAALIEETMDSEGADINRSEMARVLGLHRATLYRRKHRS